MIIQHLAAIGGHRGGAAYFLTGAVFLTLVGVVSIVWPDWAKRLTRSTRRVGDPSDRRAVRLIGVVAVAVAVICLIIGLAEL